MAGLGVLLLCLVQIHLAEGAGGVYGKPSLNNKSNWNYLWGTQLGNWAAQHSICGHKKQSPINVLSRDTQYDSKLGSLKLKNYEETKDVYFLMKNRNTDIEFRAWSAGTIPQTVEFKGITYRLFQFHTHWGSTNFQGSEHLVDSQQYAAEMHIIHYNTKYADVGEAINKPDGLLVWGHFLKVDRKSAVENQAFNDMLNKFGDANKCCSVTNMTLNLFDILPKKHSDFYHYSGSLTTPPCYESVQWIVNRDPILVSENQIKKFQDLKDIAMGAEEPLVNHYRPVQPLNGRTVYRNFKDLECSAAVALKPLSMFTLLVATAYFTV